MSDKKIYSAFISSAFQSLRDERNQVIDSLLDFRILPIGMEHFTVSTSGEFSDIEELIDDSDFFVMLLGKTYGSCDKNGVSWTEREYRYAVLKKKPIIAIICDELAENLRKNATELTEDQLKQINFCKSIEYAREVSSEFSIKTIVSQFFNTHTFSKCVGWTRIEDISKNASALAKWREEHRVYDLAGNWYHVHLSEEDEKYIRLGNIKIEQDFTPEGFKALTISGENFSLLYYSIANHCFICDEMKHTRFTGNYQLQENGEILGIFNSQRSFRGSFNSQEVTKGSHRGIHDFSFDVSNETTLRINGEFHDEAPSPKQGRIFIFRNEKDRDQFLLNHRGHIINQK